LDLSFTRFDREVEVTEMPGSLSVLLVGVAARQAASATAAAQARMPAARPCGAPFAPADGAFNGEVAQAVGAWNEGEAAVYRDALEAGKRDRIKDVRTGAVAPPEVE
jgi:hypothetical protein